MGFIIGVLSAGGIMLYLGIILLFPIIAAIVAIVKLIKNMTKKKR